MPIQPIFTSSKPLSAEERSACLAISEKTKKIAGPFFKAVALACFVGFVICATAGLGLLPAALFLVGAVISALFSKTFNAKPPAQTISETPISLATYLENPIGIQRLNSCELPNCKPESLTSIEVDGNQYLIHKDFQGTCDHPSFSIQAPNGYAFSLMDLCPDALKKYKEESARLNTIATTSADEHERETAELQISELRKTLQKEIATHFVKYLVNTLGEERLYLLPEITHYFSQNANIEATNQKNIICAEVFVERTGNETNQFLFLSSDLKVTQTLEIPQNGTPIITIAATENINSVMCHLEIINLKKPAPVSIKSTIRMGIDNPSSIQMHTTVDLTI